MKEIIVESKKELTNMAKNFALKDNNLKFIDNNSKIKDKDVFLGGLKEGLYNSITDKFLDKLVKDEYLVDKSLVNKNFWDIIYNPDNMNYFVYKEILYKPKDKEIIIIDSQEELESIARWCRAAYPEIEYITDEPIRKFKKFISGYPDALEFLNFYKGPGFYWIRSEKEIKLIYQYGDKIMELEHCIYKLKEVSNDNI